MIDGAALGLVVGGLVLLFSGAALSVYGVVALGAFLGGGSGYLLTPAVGSVFGLDGAAVTAPVLAGALAGAVVGYVLLSAALALVGFVVGTLVTMAALAPHVLDHQWYVEWGGAIAVGLVVAVLATLVTRSALVALTAVVGAALASRSLTAEQFATARQSVSPDPLLFDVGSPTFVALVALGVCVQFGLFKLVYATRFAGAVARLPTPSGRRREPEPRR
jgi:hypothetical protein